MLPRSPRRVSVRELKAHTSEVLREVRETGAEFIISMRGRPIARLEPLEVREADARRDGMGDSRGAIAGLPALDWDDFVEAKSVWHPAASDDG